jgi:hypothetical protein
MGSNLRSLALTDCDDLIFSDYACKRVAKVSSNSPPFRLFLESNFCQGDQIGRIFANFRQFTLDSVFENEKSSKKVLLLLKMVKHIQYFWPKMDWAM